MTAHAQRNGKLKAHDDAVKRGFPTFTHRWFDRPVFRRQQAEDGVGPLFCMGVRPRELQNMTEFNRKWINEQFSARAQRDAFIYLDIWNAGQSYRCERQRLCRSQKV
eukprot:6472968-Amphidinium_carterae.1